MKVMIKKRRDVIWFITTDMKGGMSCGEYIADGIQDEIIAALEYALLVAKDERLCWLNGNGPPESGEINTACNNDVPVPS